MQEIQHKLCHELQAANFEGILNLQASVAGGSAQQQQHSRQGTQLQVTTSQLPPFDYGATAVCCDACRLPPPQLGHIRIWLAHTIGDMHVLFYYLPYIEPDIVPAGICSCGTLRCSGPGS